MLERILNNRTIVLYLLPFCLGLLTVFSFQPFNLSLINFFILPIFFFFLVYVRKRSKSIYRKKPYQRNLFLIGFVFGFGFYLSGIFWIAYSLTFDDNFKFLIPFAVILIPLFLSLFTGLTTLIAGQFLSYNFSSLLLFSVSFALSDYIRGKILTGFPWNLWGYSWSWLTEVLQILNFLGLYAFNLIAITIFTVPAVLFFIMSITKLRSWMISSIPLNLRIAMGAGVGLFIGFIGLKNGGIIVANGATFLSLGDFTNPSTLLAGIGFLLISILSIRKIPGAIIIGILAVTLISIFLKLVEFDGVFALPPDVTPVLMQLDIIGALDVAMISVIVSFLFVNLFDTAGTLFGVATRANLIDESCNIKDIIKKGKEIEEDSNQILDFTKEVKNMEIQNTLGFQGSYISDLFFQSIGISFLPMCFM